MKYVLIILVILKIFIISVTFGAQKCQVVTCHYILAQNQFLVLTVLTLLFVVEFVIGLGICGLFWRLTRFTLLKTEQNVKRLKQQLAPAKTVPSVFTRVLVVAPKE